MANEDAPSGIGCTDKKGNIGCSSKKTIRNDCCGDFCDFDILSAGMARTALDLHNMQELDGKALFGNKLSHKIIEKGSVIGLEKLLASREAECALSNLITEQQNSDYNLHNGKGGDVMHDLPYYLICFAKNEHDTVKSFLRNYINREIINVELKLSSEFFLHKKLPGHYYRPVKVCKNCYNVYRLIQAYLKSKETSSRKDDQKEKLLFQSRIRLNNSLYSRSTIARKCVSKSDISEICSFSNPPPAVRMVCDAVSIILKESTLEWKLCRIMMSKVENFMYTLKGVIPSGLKKRQISDLSRYVRNPFFRPHEILSVSRAAAKLCAWVLGTFNLFLIEKGHDVDDNLENFLSLISSIGSTKSGALTTDVTKLVPRKAMIDEEKEAMNPVAKRITDSRDMTTKTDASETLFQKKASTLRQQRYVNKLSAKKSGHLHDNSATRNLLCSDGITRIPYEVIGDDSVDFRYMSFVVCHDLFDTISMTKLMFVDIIKRFPGSQVLLFNYPGQAWTAFPCKASAMKNKTKSSAEHSIATDQVLNCDFLADCLHQLLDHLSMTGEFVSHLKPLHLVGIGGGLSVAISFHNLFKDSSVVTRSVKSIVSINGYATMDPQITAILHATLNAFRSFPINRPDLPISFYTKFIFSDNYIKKVSRNLALNIYTAIMNPISLEGRIRLCSGALKNRDLTRVISEIAIPLICLQSVDDILISKEQANLLGMGKSIETIQLDQFDGQSLPIPQQNNEVLTLKINAGHAVWQECMEHVTLLLRSLTFPGPDYIKFIKTSTPRPTTHHSKLKVKNNVSKEGDSSDRTKRINFEGCQNDEMSSSVYHVTSKLSNDDNMPVHKKAQHTNDVDKFMGKLESTNFTTIDMPILDDESSRKSSLLRVKSYISSLTEKDVNHKLVGSEFEPPNSTKTKNFDTEILQTLDDYLKVGIPLELIPSQILDNSPTRELQQLRSWSIETKKVEGYGDTYLSVERLLVESSEELRMEIDRERSQIKENKVRREIITQELKRLDSSQEERRNKLQKDSKDKLEKVTNDCLKRARIRANDEMQRKLEIDLAEDILLQKEIFPKYLPLKGRADPVRTTVLTSYDNPCISSTTIKEKQINCALDDVEKSKSMMKKIDVLTEYDFECIKAELVQNNLERQEFKRKMDESEQQKLLCDSALLIQRIFRGMSGRQFSRLTAEKRFCLCQKEKVSVVLQACYRGRKARNDVNILRRQLIHKVAYDGSINLIQRVWRVHCDRLTAARVKRNCASTTIARQFRSYRDRIIVREMRFQRQASMLRNVSSSKIQSAWRMNVAKLTLSKMIIECMAAITLQRVYRGRIGRKRASIIKIWSNSSPGTERIELGLKLIEKSKDEFERHREEIDTLHRAQEKAETKVNQIYREIKESEEELHRLEEELKHINNIKTNHTKLECSESDTGGKESEDNALSDLVQKSELGVSIHDFSIDSLNLFEQRQMKKLLENEFTSVFAEINEKRRCLKNMEIAILDMESTRQRKDREFARLQSELMKLLDDQKHELDDIRKKGVELESAVAISALAANETANKAKENEKQIDTMFHKHEDLLKFQFMSMSMTYFSSLNMLKEIRQVNSETTASAIAASAETAASAAAAAEAVLLRGSKVDNILKEEGSLCPANSKDVLDGCSDLCTFPEDCRQWKIDDVSKWLRSLGLELYVDRFRDAAVDGEFLLELREDDLEEVLDIEHKLHRRKIMLSREKYRINMSFSSTADTIIEKDVKQVSFNEEKVEISHDVVFSQVRHGRLKRFEESLNDGFDINAEDEYGNSLLMVAVQNRHIKIVEQLLQRGAFVNHINNSGNTALHFAFAYDTSGLLPQFLIENGADDSIENINGLSPYDGIGADASFCGH